MEHNERNGIVEWVLNFFPENIREILPDWAAYLILFFVGLIALLLVLGFFGLIAKLFKRTPVNKAPNLEERFAEYPPLKASTGDRRLVVEGVPVRLRLVAIAPAGKESEVDEDNLDKLLERILPGLGLVFKGDKPRVRIWPMQLSYDGFTKHFHRNTILPEGEHQLTKWVVIAGRAKLDDCQVMLGLGLEALKPTTVGRKTIDSHEWPVVLRVRVRD